MILCIHTCKLHLCSFNLTPQLHTYTRTLSDYFPLRFLYPPSNGPETIPSLKLSHIIEDEYVKLCTAFTPYASGTSSLRLYVLEDHKERELFANIYSLGNFNVELSHSNFDNFPRFLLVLLQVVGNTMQQWPSLGRQFRCVISNQWESQSVRFHLDTNDGEYGSCFYISESSSCI